MAWIALSQVSKSRRWLLAMRNLTCADLQSCCLISNLGRVQGFCAFLRFGHDPYPLSISSLLRSLAGNQGERPGTTLEVHTSSKSLCIDKLNVRPDSVCLSLCSTTSRYARVQHEDDESGASGTKTVKCFPIGGARSTLVDQMTLLMEASAAIQGGPAHQCLRSQQRHWV